MAELGVSEHAWENWGASSEMSSHFPDVVGLQEEKFWAVVHTAWLLIRKNVLNVMHWAAVRRLYQVVISKYHVIFRYVLKCNFFLLPSENTAFLGQFSRQTQILKGIIYRLNVTPNRTINMEISYTIWFTPLSKACADFHETLSLDTFFWTSLLHCIDSWRKM
jgi:hypothetical protein